MQSHVTLHWLSGVTCYLFVFICVDTRHFHLQSNCFFVIPPVSLQNKLQDTYFPFTLPTFKHLILKFSNISDIYLATVV